MDNQAQVLIPYPESEFWNKIRDIVRTELQMQKPERNKSVEYSVNGLVQKPLFKATEVCSILSVSRQTLHSWVKEGVIKSYKIKSRLFFLASDIEGLIKLKKQ